MARSLGNVKPVGSLHLYIGCMFSGKSSRLLKEISTFTDSTHHITIQKPLLVNHVVDTRSSGEISSHSSQFAGVLCNVDAIKVDALAKVDVEGYTVLCVDEIHFFDDLFETVMKWVNAGKHVYCAGLNGDAMQKNFGQLYLLYPLADDIEFCKALCYDCITEMSLNGTITPQNLPKASFTVKTGGDLNLQREVGNIDKYLPVCRKHMNVRNSG